MEDTIKERLAELAHKQWSGWMEYLFNKCLMTQDGTAIIPDWAVERWQRQMKTPYSDLPENEKDSDRAEADKVLTTIISEKVDYKEVWGRLRSMLEGRFFGDFTVQEKIVTWMDEIRKQCTREEK